MDQLKLLMDYTKFHIGVYLTLFSSSIVLVKTNYVSLYEWIPVLICFAIAGISGGVIGSNIPNYGDFESFDIDRLGFWCFKIAPYRFWAWLEHFAFWLGLAYGAYILLSHNAGFPPTSALRNFSFC